MSNTSNTSNSDTIVNQRSKQFSPELLLRMLFPSARMYPQNDNLVLDTGGTRILVGSKEQLTTAYLDSFQASTLSNEVEAGLILIPEDVSLCGYSKTYLVCQEKPILCLGDIKAFPRTAQIGVLLLEQLILSYSVDNSAYYTENVAGIISYYYKEQANLIKDREILQMLEKQISKREKALLDLQRYKNDLKSLFPSNKNKEHKKQATVPKESIIRWLKENGSHKTTTKDIVHALHLNSLRSITNAGGIQILKDEAFGVNSDDVSTIDITDTLDV